MDVIYGVKVDSVTREAVHLSNGVVLESNAALWATGAEPQKVTKFSDLDVSRGYFRVNDHLQSTSHPNVFGGGDCVTMASYENAGFPPKAGVYAVRKGPVIA
jgi:NADH dehydrogenase FAD-containing subunit